MGAGIRREGVALKAIVTDASQRQALVAIRDLGRAGIVTGAVDPVERVPAFASRWCAWSATVPDFARDPDAFIDALLDLCKHHKPRVLIPCHDGAIEALRRRRDEVERTVAVALAPEPALGVAIDKTDTLEAATRLGVRVPRGAIVATGSEADGALEESGLPAVLKPVRSWVGTRRLAPILINEREPALEAIEEFLDAGTPVAVQEWLPGAREAVSLIYARGQMLARFAQQAHRMYPPLGGSSVLRESIPLPPDAEAAAERLVTEIDLEGYSEVEFRRDREGRAVLMEINPRLSASVEIAVRSGVPFPRLVYAWAAGERIERSNGYRVGMRMRWLGGDLSWLESALRDPGHPDLPGRARALGSFAADSLRPAGYDYWDTRDPCPALVAMADAARGTGRRAARRTRRETVDAPPAGPAPAADTEVAIVGAGPYALSLAAHLTSRGVDHQIFGQPMAGWTDHMPEGMTLKSEGCASNLSDPSGEYTLERYCEERGIEYGDVGVPVELDTFVGYGRWFQEKAVPEVQTNRVELVRADADGYQLTLDSGDTLRARRVVVASGLEGYARLPQPIGELPQELVTHSYDLPDLTLLGNQKIVVVGSGQSGLETATLLHEQGASVTLATRSPELVWNGDPVTGPRRLRTRLRYPRSGLGDGKAVFFYARAPHLFRRAFPRAKREELAFSVLGPAGAWWLRSRFEGNVEALTGRRIVAADAADGEVQLRLEGNGGIEELTAGHVVAATGYRPDLGRLNFLDPTIRDGVACFAGAPVLSDSFESSVPGLHFIGFAALVSFGPVMRFVYGADFTARHLSRNLVRAAG